jgi:hypothetical protein
LFLEDYNRRGVCLSKSSIIGKWIKKENFTTPIPGMGVCTIVYNMELLPDESTKKELEKCAEDKKDFFEWFEKEQKKLEEQYQNSSGELKISAANNLISFIMEALEKWGELSHPKGGTWKGFQKWSTTMSALRFLMKYSSDIVLNLKEPTSLGGPSQATGTISNGNVDVDSMGMVKAKAKFEGEISGHAFDGKLSLIMTECMQDFKMNALGLSTATFRPSISGIRKGTQGYTKYKGLVRILGTEVPTNTVQLKCGEGNIEFTITGYEEFKYKELLDKYFSWLVQATDKVRNEQYDNNPLQEQMHLASNVQVEFLNLLSKGQALGITDSVFTDLGLVVNRADSLFDKWFRLWFTAGLKYWQEITSSKPIVENYKEQFYFMLEAAEKIATGIISEKPFKEFKLTMPGEQIDEAFIAYYNVALKYWLEKVAKEPKTLDKSLQWVLEMSTFVLFDTISETVGRKLGLIPLPPDGFNQLKKAAGKKGLI